MVNTLGIQGVNPNGYTVMGFPSVSISGLTGLSMPYDGGHNNNTAANDTIKTFQDSLTWSHGRHSVKLGGQYQSYHWLEGAVPQNVYGDFTFTGAFTGLGFADFVLGLPSTSTRQAGRVDRTLHQTQSGLFLSDSFRVTSRFTLDFGVRWDYYTTPVYDDGYMSNWDPATGQVIVAPGTLTAVSSFFPKAATVVLGNVVPKAKTTNFRPRVAAAYRLTDNLVLRGGYGEFTENEGYGVAGRLSANNPYSLTETYTNSITAGVAALTFPKPFPASPSSSLLPGQNITALPAKTDEGVIRQFNATLETALRGFGLRLAYIGSRGVNMNYTLDVNKPAASTIPFTNSRKPFPIWASAYEVRTDGQWHYDSAVVSAQRTVGPVTFTVELHLGQQHQQLRQHDRPLQRDQPVDQGRERPPALLHGRRDRAAAGRQGTPLLRPDRTRREPSDQRLEDLRPSSRSPPANTTRRCSPDPTRPTPARASSPSCRIAWATPTPARGPFPPGSIRRPSPFLPPAPAATAPAA